MQPLNDEELNDLERFLDGEDQQDALDFVASHGFLSALACCPEALVDFPAALSCLLDQPENTLNAPELARYTTLLERWYQEIRATLYLNNPLELPFNLPTQQKPEQILDSYAADWCLGFMESVFLWQEAVEEGLEEKAVEELYHLLLAPLTLSGISDDPEIEKLQANPKILKQMVRQLPELPSTLYLLLNGGE